MAKEYFWGVQLSEEKREIKWDPDAEFEDDEDDDDVIEHFLFLKQAVLGVKAKNGERNVVEVETANFDGETVCHPLVSLTLGSSDCMCLDIGLQPPVTFRLAVGSGPVSLIGQHALDLTEDDGGERDLFEESLGDQDVAKDIFADMKTKAKKVAAKESTKPKASKKQKEDEDEDEEEEDEDDDEDEEEEEEEEEVKVAKGKKRPAPSTTGAAKKLAKMDDGTSKKKVPNGTVENGQAGHEADDDDDDEEDEDYEVEDEEEDEEASEEEEDEEMALSKDDDEDESEEDDEDDEDMEDDDDEEEDDEEDEEEEEEEEKSSPPKPQKKAKGKVNGTVKKIETPKRIETPKTGAQKKSQEKKKYTIESMKTELMKSPSKPKKEAKFKNYVKSQFDLTDSKKVQELWGWYKSTQLQ